MEKTKLLLLKKYAIENREKSVVIACLKNFLHNQDSDESNKTSDPPLEYSLTSVWLSNESLMGILKLVVTAKNEFGYQDESFLNYKNQDFIQIITFSMQ